ncbi:hypothetical protein [Celeribacter sp.]|jgi:hypothetical protein|uniref:hypothetical protein n=1 Tax=Celeribacter sp. TaxID=1890673 RepID=UPI003A9286DB
MKNLMVTTALVCVASSGAFAQEITYGGIMANYGTYSADGLDADVSVFAGDIGVAVGSFDFWIDGVQSTLSPEGIDANLSADVLTLGAGASFGNGFRVDVSSTDLSLGVSVYGLDVGIDELGVAYDSGTYFGRVSYAKLNEDTDGLLDGLWGLHGGYAFSDVAEVSLSVHGVDGEVDEYVDPIYILSGSYDAGLWDVEVNGISANILDADISLLTVGGSYDFTSDWSAYGSYSYGSIEDYDANLLRVGAAYTLNDTYKVFADYTYADVEDMDGNFDGFSIGVSMDFGDKPTSYETTADRLTNSLKSLMAYDY